MFSSRSFIVSGLTFRSLIHFEFIFVYGVRKCSNFNTIDFLSTDGHLGYFYLLAIVTNAAINTCVQTAHQVPAFFLVYASKWNCWLMGKSFLKKF